MSLETDYDRSTFEWYIPFRADYHKIAEALFSNTFEDINLPMAGTLDIGCGTGFILENFEEKHIPIQAVEGSSACIGVMPRTVSNHLVVIDASKLFYLGRKFGLVICLEVGEHLEEADSDRLVNNIVNHCNSGAVIYFSAAAPGQGGHLHLNEQPPEYWIEKFKARGFALDEKKTAAMREVAKGTQLSWLRDNGMVFRRAL